MTTYLAILIIFPARKTYFNRNVLICCLYSEMWRESNLNIKNRLYESIIIRPLLGVETLPHTCPVL